MDTTLDKGKGKAPILTIGVKLEDDATFAFNTIKGIASGLLHGVTEAMETLAVDERYWPDPTPIQKVDWSRLTNPSYVGQPTYESSVRKLIEFPS
jgi:hypothetical protein